MKTKQLFILFFLGFFSVMLTAPQKPKRSSSKRARVSTRRSSGSRIKRSAGNKRTGGNTQSAPTNRSGSTTMVPIVPLPIAISTPSVPLIPLTSDRIKNSRVTLSKDDLVTLRKTQADLGEKKKSLEKDKKDLEYIKEELEKKLKKSKSN